MSKRILIRGGGEMGSGVAWRLRRCGFDVIIAETEQPTAVRRRVSFCEAVYDGTQTVEGITARLAELNDIDSICKRGEIPLLICPSPDALGSLNPDILIDAILAKRNTGVKRGMAPRVVGLGPGFTAGDDVDCVIETNHGPNLGRCIWQGTAEANTGVPCAQNGETFNRVLRAPADGTLEVLKDIGDLVEEGTSVARVNDIDIHAQVKGVIRGMLRPGLSVTKGMKLGDIDLRSDPEICHRIANKALAIAGGVLEAVLTPAPQI
jgi:xanthine dehydrogenase accessory factor